MPNAYVAQYRGLWDCLNETRPELGSWDEKDNIGRGEVSCKILENRAPERSATAAHDCIKVIHAGVGLLTGPRESGH